MYIICEINTWRVIRLASVPAGIGINGLGRIGRLVLRRLLMLGAKRQGEAPYRVKAINSSYSAETIAHLVKYDSTHRIFPLDVQAGRNAIIVEGQRINISGEREPDRIPWGLFGATTIIEATGKFNTRQGAMRHLAGGAEKVIVTAPANDLDMTVIMGVNDAEYTANAGQLNLLSAASCTTCCVSPILDLLDRTIGVGEAWVTAVHAVTNDQNLLDNPHRDLRRARACMQSIIPTSTGIGQALQKVLPRLANSVQGLSLRVPVTDVSVADMTIRLQKPAEREAILAALGSQDAQLRHIDLNREPLVSTDYVGNEHSAIIDVPSMAVNGDHLKLLAWYDNEWGYSCRVVDLAEKVLAAAGAGARSTLEMPGAVEA